MADAAESAPHQAEKDARREKHKKRMNKILFKAWNLPDAQPFQESSHPIDAEVRDLTTVGQKLDKGAYEHGRNGWELYAKDMGFVYKRHIAKKGKHLSSAKEHLDRVVSFFSKVDPVLGDIASKAVTLDESTDGGSKKISPPTKKRKNGEKDLTECSPKKKTVVGNGESLTLSQREKRAMELLASYLEECGGESEQSHHFQCKVVQRPGGRFDSIFFSSENKRFKSMIDIARFLNLVDDRPGSSQGGSTATKNGKATNRTQRETEKKKLKRELDKITRAHGKATKALEDHNNDNRVNHFPVDDDSFWDDGSNIAKAHKAGRVIPRSDIQSFPGIPVYCIPDLLLVWDFLCTFCRVLSLEPIKLDDFAAALSFQPTPSRLSDLEEVDELSSSCIPVYLSESHIALLRLLLQDPTSDNWWWSTLETPEMAEDEGDEYLNAADKKRKTVSAVVKVDLEALLGADEESDVTTRWLQALEDVRTRKPDNSGPIKSAIKSAIAVTSNQHVKSYLKKAMRKWEARSAGLVKRAVVWLVDKVREARPDLWGRKVSDEEVFEQKKKVAMEAALEMEKIVEDADDDENENDMDLDGDSDEDSDSDEEEDSDVEDEYADQAENPVSPSRQASTATLKENDDITPVTTPVPVKPVPSLVDLLLPPAKPLHSSDLVHPLTWPPVIGATSCRVLHWYKRRKNEVDDSMREFRQLRPMSVAERRRREASAFKRILSECAGPFESDSVHVERAINHLCEGKDYLELTAVQRLCILRILVEAAYDTFRVQQTVEDNFKARINAVKALDAEERRAKKEAREEMSAIEGAARDRLTNEAKLFFVKKKRHEIIQTNKGTQEYADDFVENLTDDDVTMIDQETKAEYDALPTPESFNKGEVNAVIAKIQEETAFGTHCLVVLTLEDIERREENELKSLQEELASFGDVDSVYQNHTTDRETSAKIDRLQREVSSFSELVDSLPLPREVAIETLQDAIEDSTVKTLRSAIKSAKLSRFSGEDEETGGIWALDLLRDAALELKNAEGRKRVTEAQKDLVGKRNKCFIRTEPLGKDRYQSCFFNFDHIKDGRIWVERDFILQDDYSKGYESSVNPSVLFKSAAMASTCAMDKKEDFLSPEDRDQPYGKAFLSFARQEYHHSAQLSTLANHHWSCYTTDRSLRILVKNLDGKCAKEGCLKIVLKETLEALALPSGGVDFIQAPTNSNQVTPQPNPLTNGSSTADSSFDKKDIAFLSSGDGEVFRDALLKLPTSDVDLLDSTPSAIGKRVRLRRIPDSERAPDVAQYSMGTITGWKIDTVSTEEFPTDDTMTKITAGTESPYPVWRLALDDGGEYHLSSSDLIEGILRAARWSTQQPGYVEHDAPFLSYRNPLGRYCGRAVDAPSSMTPMAFAKQLLKKEHDLYAPLKNRTFENNWGGKCGARNAWTGSLKEYGHTFNAVRDGLLTLENAFFDLAGGFSNDLALQDSEKTAERASQSKLSGKDLMNDENTRFDIELESLGNEVKGLWNNPDTRAIFRDIITEGNTVSVLALGLDLVCRNCQAYIDRTKSSVVHQPAYAEQATGSVVGSRRAAMQRPGAYSAFF